MCERLLRMRITQTTPLLVFRKAGLLNSDFAPPGCRSFQTDPGSSRFLVTTTLVQHLHNCCCRSQRPVDPTSGRTLGCKQDPKTFGVVGSYESTTCSFTIMRSQFGLFGVCDHENIKLVQKQQQQQQTILARLMCNLRLKTMSR